MAKDRDHFEIFNLKHYTPAFWVKAQEIYGKTSLGTFSLDRLLATYLDVALTSLHRKYALIPISKKNPLLKGLEINERNTHCEQVARAIEESVKWDFRGASIPTLNNHLLLEKTKATLANIYDQEMKASVGPILEKLFEELFSKAEITEVSSLLSHLKDRVYREIQELFHVDIRATDLYPEARNLILKITSHLAPVLAAAIELRILLKPQINALYEDRKISKIEHIPSAEGLFRQAMENKFFTRLSEDQYEELKIRITKYINNELISLKQELDPNYRVIRRGSNPCLK